MKRTLLLVDDEENIVRSLVRLLRRDGYNILTANSGKEGLDILSENDVGVIISDQRMPEMNGVEFLSQVKECYPDNVRIVLSGYTDLKSVTDAINEGAIYKFLTKPWEDELLRAHVKDAFEHYELANENERLGKELQQVNKELSIANEQLQHNVDQKSRYVEINLKALQVSQEILENLPVGVLGIGEDGMIATANLQAHTLLCDSATYLVGANVSQVLPDNVVQCYNNYVGATEPGSFHIELTTGNKIDIMLCPLGRDSDAHGVIMVISRSK